MACSLVSAFGDRGSTAKTAVDEGMAMAITRPTKRLFGFRIFIICCLAGLQVFDDLGSSPDYRPCSRRFIGDAKSHPCLTAAELNNGSSHGSSRTDFLSGKRASFVRSAAIDLQRAGYEFITYGTRRGGGAVCRVSLLGEHIDVRERFTDRHFLEDSASIS